MLLSVAHCALPLVSPRCTPSPPLASLSLPALPPAPPQVHRGFYYAYHKSQLRPRILLEVLRLLAAHPGYSVGVTGHSLGGALASLCGLDLAVCPRCALRVQGQVAASCLLQRGPRRWLAAEVTAFPHALRAQPG